MLLSTKRAIHVRPNGTASCKGRLKAGGEKWTGWMPVRDECFEWGYG
jgi:hypothetical protein